MPQFEIDKPVREHAERLVEICSSELDAMPQKGRWVFLMELFRKRKQDLDDLKVFQREHPST